MLRIRYCSEPTNKQYYEKGWLWCRGKYGLDWERIAWSYWLTSKIVIFWSKKTEY